MGRSGNGPVLAMVVALALTAGGAAQAQSLSGLAGQLLGGGQQQQPATPPAAGQSALPGVAGALMGQGLPSLSSAGTDNVAGLLHYCIQNSLVTQAGASSVLGGLLNQGGVSRSSPGFTTGQNGLLQTGNNDTFSLSSLTDQLKSRLCDMILSKAKSLL